MAIGTLATVGIAAAAGGSVLSARSQSKASKRAAGVAQDTAAQNNALARDIYAKNEGYLAPYAQQGLGATSALNDFYGLSQPQQQQTQAMPNALAQFQPGVMGEGFDSPFGGYGGEWAAWGEPRIPGPISGFGGGTFDMQGNPVTVGTQGQPAPQANAGDPFKRYIANSDYAFQFGEGANRVNSGYAGAGTLQSGAAMKSMEDYRQNLQSGYRNQWAQGVANQQGVGLQGAGALAGVGIDYSRDVSNNNNNAGSAAAGAALMRGQNNPLAAGLGALGGNILGFGR